MDKRNLEYLCVGWIRNGTRIERHKSIRNENVVGNPSGIKHVVEHLLEVDYLVTPYSPMTLESGM